MKQLLVAESAARAMFEVAQAAKPHEAGGILLGVFSDAIPWVTHAVVVPSTEVGPNHYVIPGGITPLLVDCARTIDDRLGYLGDWHAHPSDIGASPQDRSTMRKTAAILNGKGTVPWLVVVRPRNGGHVLDGYFATRFRVTPSRTTLTGDLSPTG